MLAGGKQKKRALEQKAVFAKMAEIELKYKTASGQL